MDASSSSNSFFEALLARINALLARYESSYIGRHRLLILSVYFVTLDLLLLSNILGISGAFHPFFTASNSLLLLISFILAVAYLCRKIDIVTTLSLMSLSTQVALSTDTLYSAFDVSVPNTYMVIIINMLLLACNTIVALSTYLTRITQINTAIILATYTVCIIKTNDPVLLDYYFMLFMVLVFFSFLGFHIAKNARRLEVENTALRKDEAQLLQVLRLNKKQVKAYICLASESHDAQQTHNLLDMLGETSQKNILANVREFLRVSNTEKMQIDDHFPELTNSEKAICQLILRGKKLGAICAILGKTESNVNTQRANIRRKLGLATPDSLQEALQQRLDKGFVQPNMGGSIN